jgi:hypothetical protein
MLTCKYNVRACASAGMLSPMVRSGWGKSWRRGLVVAVGVVALGCGSDGGREDGEDDGGPGFITLDGSGGSTEGGGSGQVDGDADAGEKLDVAAGSDLPSGCAGDSAGGGGGGMGGEGDLELSYIWIANSAQGTVSKIDTVTMIEEGRYAAKPAGGDPSRTSVNLQGDVAVANRNGGVAKFWANPDDCQDLNGNGIIETSSGGADVLGFGQDECMAWYTDLACSSNRPVAWTRGEFDQSECAYTGANLWTVCDSNTLLIDGQTGAILQTIPVPSPSGYSFVYGGAADGDSNFWGLDLGSSQLYRVDHEDYSVQAWPLSGFGGYGITVDSNGRPWVCGGGGVARFNVDTATWDIAGTSGIGGCMTDGESLIWHSNPSGLLLGYDIDSLAVVEQVQLPEYVHGVSVDFQGHVWGVSFAGSNAYRADPVTDVVDTFANLVGAYTYSDMTGFALSSAGTIDPQQG